MATHSTCDVSKTWTILALSVLLAPVFCLQVLAFEDPIYSGDICTFEPVDSSANWTYSWNASDGHPSSSDSRVFEWTAPMVFYTSKSILITLIVSNSYCPSTDEMAVTVHPKPGLEVRKWLESPDSVPKVGDVLSYKIKIINVGQTKVVSIPLVDDYPEDVMIPLGSDIPWDEDDGTKLRWNNLVDDPLDLGEAVVISADFRVISSSSEAVVNFARIEDAKDDIGNSISPIFDEETVEKVDVFDDLGPDRTCEYATIHFFAASRVESCKWNAFDLTGSEVGGFNDTRTSKVEWTPTDSGEYNITVLMSDHDWTLLRHQTVSVSPRPNCTIVGENVVCNDTWTTFHAIVDPDCSYRWDASAGSFRADDLPSVEWRSPEVPGEYQINLTVVSKGGCSCSGTHRVEVEPCASKISLVKDCIYEDPTRVGDTVVYTYSVTNAGDLSLGSVNLTDVQEWGPGCDPRYVGGDSNEDDLLDPDESWRYECLYVVPNPADYEILSIMSTANPLARQIQRLSRTTSRLKIKIANLIDARERFDFPRAELEMSQQIVLGKRVTFYNYTNSYSNERLSLMKDEHDIIIKSEYYNPISDTVLTSVYAPSGESVSDLYISKQTKESLRLEYDKPMPGYCTYTIIDYGTGDSLISIVDATGATIERNYRRVPGYLVYEKEIWLHNTATVTAQDLRGKTVLDWDVYSLKVEPPLPILKITKIADPDPVNPGELLTYTIEYSNQGMVEAHDVVIVETYDENVSFVSSSSEPDFISGSERNRWSLGDLMQGAFGTITIDVLVDPGLETGHVLENLVNISCSENVTENASVITRILAPNIKIWKEDSPDPVDVGSLLNYTIIYENLGDAAAHNVEIKESYDANVSFVASNPEPDEGTNDHWTLGNLSSKEKGTVFITVQVRPQTGNGTILNNTARITCNEGFFEEAKANTTVGAPILKVKKVAPSDLVRPGSWLNYTITVVNEGTANATNVIVTDVIDPNLDFNITNSSPNYSHNDRTYMWHYESLGPEESISIKINTTVLDNTSPNSSVIYNRYKANCTQSEGVFSTLVTWVISSLWIDKIAEKSTYETAEQVIYHITYGTDLNPTASNVTIVDHFPQDLVYVSATPSPDTIRDGVLIWNMGPLEENQTGSIELLFDILKRPDVRFEETSSISGEGFVSLRKHLSTTRDSYKLINRVNITGCYTGTNNSLTSHEDSASITVTDMAGATISTLEHGSGYYEEEVLSKLNTTNGSIQMDKQVFASHKPTSFSLPGTDVSYDSLWTDWTCAKNLFQGESVAESYRYMEFIEKNSSFLVDENETAYASDAEFSGGIAQIGYLKRDQTSGKTVVELSDRYHGDFRAETHIESGGSSEKSVKGIGFVASDKRVDDKVGSFEHGSGYYESEEKVSSSTIQKDVSMAHIPEEVRLGSFGVNYSSRWGEGIWAKDKDSSIGERISFATRIDKESEITPGSMALFGDFEGYGEILAVSKYPDGERARVDQVFHGDYTIATSVAIYKTPKYLEPHINLTKTVSREDETIKFNINVTNDGNKPLGPINLSDHLPEGMTFIKSNPKPEVVGEVVIWTISSIPIGGMQTVELWASETDSKGTLTNKANATAYYDGGVVTADCSCKFDSANWLSIPTITMANVSGAESPSDETTSDSAKISARTRPVLLNLMIDAELYPVAANETIEDSIEIEAVSLIDMLNEIDPEELNVTIYSTSDFVSARSANASYKLYATRIGAKDNHEMAFHGMTTDELLGTMTYGVQYPLLIKAKRLVEEAYICEGRKIEAKGFRPQQFNQSETTYKILDKMGFEYDSGYLAGLIYLPDHENDTWPYPAEGHRFYAVPVSTHLFSGELVPLSDRFAKEELGLTGSQWYDLLIAEFEECSKEGDPMVVIFHNFVYGTDEEYQKAYTGFVEYAISKRADFISTMELVEIAKDPSKAGYLSITDFDDEEQIHQTLHDYGAWKPPEWNMTCEEMGCYDGICEYYDNLE